MKFNKQSVSITYTVLILIVLAVVAIISTFTISKNNTQKNMVSIEYYSTCQCGNKKMECYKSFVDGYEYKECKECGSYYDNKGDK